MVINGETYTYDRVHLEYIFRPGDEILIHIYVICPDNQKVIKLEDGEYEVGQEWTEDNYFKVKVNNENIGRTEKIIKFKSSANYHLNRKYEYDDLVVILYIVVP